MSWAGTYRRMIASIGERVTIRRGAGSTAESHSVRARVTGYAPDELVGDIQQGDRQALILAEDLILTPQLRKGDHVIVRGQNLIVESVDDNTHRIRGTLYALIVRSRGH